MEKINNRRYELTLHDLAVLGSEVERALKAIKEKAYGIYSAEDLEVEEKLALRVASGMHEWQWEHNKGIRVCNDVHIQVEIYDLHAVQKQIDETMGKDLYEMDA